MYRELHAGSLGLHIPSWLAGVVTGARTGPGCLPCMSTWLEMWGGGHKEGGVQGNLPSGASASYESQVMGTGSVTPRWGWRRQRETGCHLVSDVLGGSGMSVGDKVEREEVGDRTCPNAPGEGGADEEKLEERRCWNGGNVSVSSQQNKLPEGGWWWRDCGEGLGKPSGPSPPPNGHSPVMTIPRTSGEAVPPQLPGGAVLVPSGPRPVAP